MAAKRLLSARRVAGKCDVDIRTLHTWERRGILVPVRINGRRYFDGDAVVALMSGEGPPTLDEYFQDQTDTPYTA